MKEHHYRARTLWTGNEGSGTAAYDGYGRNFEVSFDGKATLLGSSDPHFRGDGSRLNPEDMMVSAVSTCHMLWYLHLCAVAGVIVMSYVDEAEGVMVEEAQGGHFKKVTLRPNITITRDSPVDIARALHSEAHALCFIANSVKFEIAIEPHIERQSA